MDQNKNGADFSAVIKEDLSFFRLLVESSITPFYVIDPEDDWRMIYANKATCDHFGHSFEKLTTMRIPDWDIAFDISSLPTPPFNLRVGETYQGESVHKTSSGETIPVEITSRFIKYKGKILCFGNFFDISKRKKLEALLKEHEKNLIEAQRIAHLGNWVSDLSRNLLFASEELFRIFGLPREKPPISSSAFFDLAHPDDLKRAQAAARSMPDDCLSYRIEFRIIRPDGEERIVMVNEETVTDEAGRPLYIIGAAQDITCQRNAEAERLAMERKLLQTQKLESLGTLAGGIAHDFNNILMVILGNLDLALRDIPKNSKAGERIERAVKAGKMAADLTSKMLAYAGKGSFVLKELNINSLIKANAALFRSFVSKNIELNIKLAPDLPNICADSGQILQTIMNLLINASEAIGKKEGKINLETGGGLFDQKTLDLSVLEDKPRAGPFVWFEVSDTGCGMDDETMRRIFEPFFSTKFTGRGLGMPSALGIIRAHHGALFIESELGKGSKFRALFPVDNPQWSSFLQRIRRFEKSDIQKCDSAILIVDDESSVRELCATFLKSCGHRAVEAATASEALDFFRENQSSISLIILDFQMPGMDGVQAFHEFKKIRRDVSVLFCSGFDEKKALSLFSEPKPEGFIQKPFLKDDLMSKIEKILKRDI